jgi:hypothetical protein
LECKNNSGLTTFSINAAPAAIKALDLLKQQFLEKKRLDIHISFDRFPERILDPY